MSADVLKKMFPLLAFSLLRRKRTVVSSGVRLCKILNTSIYYVFITTRSYIVTPTPVRPSCNPLDGDERHDHPLLHASPGSQHVAQLLYRFWNRNPARIVLPWRLIFLLYTQHVVVFCACSVVIMSQYSTVVPSLF